MPKFDSAARPATLMPMQRQQEEASPPKAAELPSIESLELAAPFQSVTTTNLFAQIAFGGGFTTIFSFCKHRSGYSDGQSHPD